MSRDAGDPFQVTDTQRRATLPLPNSLVRNSQGVSYGLNAADTFDSAGKGDVSHACIIKHDLPDHASDSCVSCASQNRHKDRMGKLLGQALKAAREQRKMRQQDVADALKVSRAAVGQWESGTTEPSTQNLLQACELLKINVSAATSGMVKFVPFPNKMLDGSLLMPDMGDDEMVQMVKDRRPELRTFEDEVGHLIGTGVESRLMPRDVPVFGAAYAGDDGDFFLNGEIIDYVRRPPGIHSTKGVYAVFVTGTSMYPRYEQGDICYVNPNRAPSIGEDAIVQLKPTGPGAPGLGFLKRLVKRGPMTTTFEQFNPAGTIEIENDHIQSVHRVIPIKELLAV